MTGTEIFREMKENFVNCARRSIAKNRLKLENFTGLCCGFRAYIPEGATSFVSSGLRRVGCIQGARWGAGRVRDGVQAGCGMGVGHTIGASGRDITFINITELFQY